MGCCYLTYHNFPVLFPLAGAVFHFLNFYPVRCAPFLLEQPFPRPGHDVSVLCFTYYTFYSGRLDSAWSTNNASPIFGHERIQSSYVSIGIHIVNTDILLQVTLLKM